MRLLLIPNFSFLIVTPLPKSVCSTLQSRSLNPGLLMASSNVVSSVDIHIPEIKFAGGVKLSYIHLRG